ncbi:hypothetical protein KNP414_03476 [Paenibacillus mucilaginosus KNP414]|uniref:Uncharacterized protein n=1 Tax=Paenibacillus mucilaginosus (strain KNP414) TaxID=1036673 RepID=F8F8X2_PAEMK|nr:hypothetical protein KNP414_03476 [Paenibacillus mucilaginosus KNP414]
MENRKVRQAPPVTSGSVETAADMPVSAVLLIQRAGEPSCCGRFAYRVEERYVPVSYHR